MVAEVRYRDDDGTEDGAGGPDEFVAHRVLERMREQVANVE